MLASIRVCFPKGSRERFASGRVGSEHRMQILMRKLETLPCHLEERVLELKRLLSDHVGKEAEHRLALGSR
jgi:hypothetical protein